MIKGGTGSLSRHADRWRWFVSRGEDGRLWFDLDKAEGLGVLDLEKYARFHEKADAAGNVTRWVELGFYDAQGALQLLGKGYGLFVERVEVEKREVPPVTIDEYKDVLAQVAKWEKERMEGMMNLEELEDLGD
jgi:hypothetical protein